MIKTSSNRGLVVLLLCLCSVCLLFVDCDCISRVPGAEQIAKTEPHAEASSKDISQVDAGFPEERTQEESTRPEPTPEANTEVSSLCKSINTSPVVTNFDLFRPEEDLGTCLSLRPGKRIDFAPSPVGYRNEKYLIIKNHCKDESIRVKLRIEGGQGSGEVSPFVLHHKKDILLKPGAFICSSVTFLASQKGSFRSSIVLESTDETLKRHTIEVLASTNSSNTIVERHPYPVFDKLDILVLIDNQKSSMWPRMKHEMKSFLSVLARRSHYDFNLAVVYTSDDTDERRAWFNLRDLLTTNRETNIKNWDTINNSLSAFTVTPQKTRSLTDLLKSSLSKNAKKGHLQGFFRKDARLSLVFLSPGDLQGPPEVQKELISLITSVRPQKARRVSFMLPATKDCTKDGVVARRFKGVAEQVGGVFVDACKLPVFGYKHHLWDAQTPALNREYLPERYIFLQAEPVKGSVSLETKDKILPKDSFWEFAGSEREIWWKKYLRHDPPVKTILIRYQPAKPER